MPTFGSLFAGIGGIDLGLERAGWECRFQIEWDEWCQRVLAKHWPDVPRYGDITGVDWSGVERVDLLAGGFPCQPVSAAGRQAAQEDARWLWPEFHRAIRALRPGLVLVENVTNLLAIGDGSAFGDVLGDLAASGYDAEWDCIPAAAVGAPHERDRVFVVAYPGSGDGGTWGPGRSEHGREGLPQHAHRCEMADTAGGRRERGRVAPGTPDGGRVFGLPARPGQELAHADGPRLEGRVFQPERAREWFAGPSGMADADRVSSGRSTESRRERPVGLAEPGLGGTPHGLPSGLDHRWPAPPGPQYDWEPPRTVRGRVPDRTQRLKACGNAVVPQVVEVIGRQLLGSASRGSGPAIHPTSFLGRNGA